MELSEDKKAKLRTLFNLKYIECLMPSVFEAIFPAPNEMTSKGAEDYSFANLNLEFDRWNDWKESHGIKKEIEGEKNYFEIDGIANSTLFIPAEFVEKVFILGFLP